MTLTRIAPPADPLISLDDMKIELRVDGDADDKMIARLLDAALSHLDGPRGVLGRCIQRQTWRMGPVLGGALIRLPLPHVESAEAHWLDGDAVRHPVEIALAPCGPLSPFSQAAFAIPPEAPGIFIEMVVESPEDIQAAALEAVMMLVGHWYMNREAVVTGTIATEIPLGVQRLLTPLKLWGA